MKRKLIIIACLSCLFCSSALHGQENPAKQTANISPAKLALIKELLELSNIEKTMDAMMQAQTAQMDKALPELLWQTVSNMDEVKDLTASQREELHAYVVEEAARAGKRTYELLMQKMDVNKLIEDISVPLYDKYFSENELRDLIAFNKSSTGQRLLQVMPNLIGESMTLTTQRLMPLLSEVIEQVQKEQTTRLASEIKTKVEQTPRPPSHKPSRRRSRH